MFPLGPSLVHDAKSKKHILLRATGAEMQAFLLVSIYHLWRYDKLIVLPCSVLRGQWISRGFPILRPGGETILTAWRMLVWGMVLIEDP